MAPANIPEQQQPGKPDPEQAMARQEPVTPPEYCRNCGALMSGEFCAKCGQSRRHHLRSFPAVIGDVIAETFEIDGRLARTLRTLLLQPGRITIDYLAGRRVHYSPPVRFYLFTSLFAFLLISIQVDRGMPLNVEIGPQAGQVQQDAAADGVLPGNAETDEPSRPADDAPGNGARTLAPANEDEFRLPFNDRPWHATDNPVRIGWLPAAANHFINHRIGQLQHNIPRIRENPRLLVNAFLGMLPQTMLVLLPVFALILKLFYPLARRLYMEHVIFSIHIHSFTLLIVILVIMAGWLDNLSQAGALQTFGDLVKAALLTWLPVYNWLAQKRVYRQNWFITTLKYTGVYSTYVAVQSLALGIVLLLGASSL